MRRAPVALVAALLVTACSSSPLDRKLDYVQEKHEGQLKLLSDKSAAKTVEKADPAQPDKSFPCSGVFTILEPDHLEVVCDGKGSGTHHFIVEKDDKPTIDQVLTMVTGQIQAQATSHSTWAFSEQQSPEPPAFTTLRIYYSSQAPEKILKIVHMIGGT